ncbi:hypothetical protein [Streptomyces sp. NPDC059398]|uniref:hypothetical protein n=1 Tax=Streptomyces sp. NPDC059398 TaxID=3346820 RepID=UPI0036BCE652
MAAVPSPALRTAPPPASRGGIALAQGRYGVRGNLELLLCDEADGLWVLWFNSDPQGTEPEPGGPPPGEWSGALRFGAGRRYDSVEVVQSRHGSHHLEVLARSGSTPCRLRWSPEAAFTDEEPPPVGPARSVTAAETPDGTPWTGAVGEGGGARLLHADTTAYPRLAWSEAPLTALQLPESQWSAVLLVPLPGGARPGVALLGPDGGRYAGPAGGAHPLPASEVGTAVAPGGVPRLYLWRRDAAVVDVVHPGRPTTDRRLVLPGTGEVTAIAATPLAHAPGRTDLVVRRGGRLWHLRDHGEDGPVAAAPLVSRLTRVTGDGEKPVHRTS